MPNNDPVNGVNEHRVPDPGQTFDARQGTRDKNTDQPVTISLCMIVKNEEKTLGRCLDSIAGLMDEIIIVDTGSTDGTLAVAASYTDNIYSFSWNDDFAAARNYSFGHATRQYVMWLDADDVVSERDRGRLAVLKRQLPPDVDAVIMGSHLAGNDSDTPLFVSRRTRLVRRGKHFRWHGRLHEDLDIRDGKTIIADIVIHHMPLGSHTERNRRILERWIAEEGRLTGRLLFHYANETFDAGQFGEAAAAYEQLLREASGYREDRITACVRLAECYKRTDDPERRLNSLLRSLRYAVPQSDVCCAIGDFFGERREWENAIYWYTQAVRQQGRHPGTRPVPLIAYSWLPHVRLSCCYAAVGELREAHAHNEQALSHLPGDASLLGNKRKLEAALGADGKCGDRAATRL